MAGTVKGFCSDWCGTERESWREQDLRGKVVCGTLWVNCVCVLLLNMEFQCEPLYL